jgi:MFS family permease
MIADTARRWWALIAIAVCVLVVGLDLTVLNLALPTLARDLHASNGDLQWFASVYSLAVAAALLPAGLLGDRFGRKRVLLAALAVFGVSSAACAYATSVGHADRGPRLPRPGGRRDIAALAVGPAGVLHGEGTAESHRRDHGGHLYRLSRRPAAWRLAAGQLLVGIGVPDQRSCRGAGAGSGG